MLVDAVEGLASVAVGLGLCTLRRERFVIAGARSRWALLMRTFFFVARFVASQPPPGFEGAMQWGFSASKACAGVVEKTATAAMAAKAAARTIFIDMIIPSFVWVAFFKLVLKKVCVASNGPVDDNIATCEVGTRYCLTTCKIGNT